MFPELTPWVAPPRVAGKLRPSPGLRGLPGRKQRMNGLGRRMGAVPGALAQAPLGSERPVWQRPEPFETFCGCWLLLTHSLFQPFTLSPDRKPLLPPPPTTQASLGNRGSLLGDALKAVLEQWDCTGYQEARLRENWTSLSPILVSLAKPLCSLGLDVLSCTMEEGGLILTFYGHRVQKRSCWFLSGGGALG